MHRRTGLLILVASLLFLASLACGGPTEPTNPPQPPPPTEVLIVVEPTMPPEPTVAPEPTEVPPLPIDYTCECDPRAEPIEINTTIPLNMHTATGGYPANCQYWCACVPSGGTSLDIGITDFSVDLDIYVAWNDYEGVTGQTPIYGESYTWMSNAYGTGDEWINAASPEGGPYYIEVCSYEGSPSPYNLVTEFR